MRNSDDDWPITTGQLNNVYLPPSIFLSLIQVEPSATSLNTNDVFVLKSPDSMWLWKGLGAREEELAAANYVASFLDGGPTEVVEKEEPGEWHE